MRWINCVCDSLKLRTRTSSTSCHALWPEENLSSQHFCTDDSVTNCQERLQLLTISKLKMMRCSQHTTPFYLMDCILISSLFKKYPNPIIRILSIYTFGQDAVERLVSSKKYMCTFDNLIEISMKYILLLRSHHYVDTKHVYKSEVRFCFVKNCIIMIVLTFGSSGDLNSGKTRRLWPGWAPT